MNLKEILTRVKAVFDAPAVAPVAPVAPAATTSPAPTVYTLQDGTQVAIQQAGTIPAPGDMVTIAGAPAPEGMLVLQDGSTITCDATGKITLYTPVGGNPVTTDAPGADAAAKIPVGAAPAIPTLPAKSPVPGVPGKSGYSDADKAALLAAFDTASGDDLMTVLTTCVKALMQSEFGWQILEQKRLADTNAAITAYQNSLQSLQASSQKLDTANPKDVIIKELQAEVAKHKATITGMFEFMEAFASMPTASPKTITGSKKDEFTAQAEKTEAKFKKIATDLKEAKQN